MQLNWKLSFGEHLRIGTAKGIQCEANLARLMPNIGGPREDKRRQVASVMQSKLLYAAPVWSSVLKNHAIQKKLSSAQRSVALRIASAYRTVLTSAVLVQASVLPIDLSAKERKETFQLRKELICKTNQPGWIESTAKSDFTWRKRFWAMAASMRTWSASRRETINCVATALSRISSLFSISFLKNKKKSYCLFGLWKLESQASLWGKNKKKGLKKSEK